MFHLVEFCGEQAPDGSVAQGIISDEWVVCGDGGILDKAFYPPKYSYKMAQEHIKPTAGWDLYTTRILGSTGEYILHFMWHLFVLFASIYALTKTHNLCDSKK